MKREYYPYLTIGRFLAAFLVMLFHSREVLGGVLDSQIISKIAENGFMGVSFFFVLSGFLLGRLYNPENINAKVFAKTRWARIYPTYLLCAIPYIAQQIIVIANQRTPSSVLELLLPLAMIQVWFVGYSQALMGPGWSLSCEMFFYALFPWMRSQVEKQKLRGFVLVIILSQFIPIVVTSSVRQLGHVGVDSTVYFLVSFPFIHICSFILGVYAAQYRMPQKYAIPAILVGAILMLGVVFTEIDVLYKCSSGTSIPMALIVAAAASLPSPPQQNWIIKTFVLLGDASYVLYLTHRLGFAAMEKVFRTHSLPITMLQMVIIIVVAVLIHLYIEKPLLKKFKPATVMK